MILLLSVVMHKRRAAGGLEFGTCDQEPSRLEGDETREFERKKLVELRVIFSGYSDRLEVEGQRRLTMRSLSFVQGIRALA